MDKTGWIARDGNGSLWYFTDEPRWNNHTGAFEPLAGNCWKIVPLNYPRYSAVKPGECIQIGDDADALDAYSDSSDQMRLGAVQAEFERVRAERDEAVTALSEIATNLFDDPRHAMRIARAAMDKIKAQIR